MSSAISVPNPCLVAILLVCQTRSGSGPQHVFHWPPDPFAKPASSNQHPGDTTDEDQSSSDSDDESSDGGYSDLDRDGHSLDQHTGASNRLNTTARQYSEASGPKKTLLGLEEDGLISLLAPDRTWNKRKFELSINELTFVGRPVFANSNGTWRRERKETQAKQRPISPEAEQTTEDEENHDDPTPADSVQAKNHSIPVKSELTMFNAVFVMNPPPLDHAHRVKEMYDNVIKKFSRALKWVQAHDDYVKEQAETILNQKQRLVADDSDYVDVSMSTLLASSSLATAIRSIYDAIAASRIASITLARGVSLSLQIPPVTSTAYLPSLTEPPIPRGLWLTTATEAPPEPAATDKRAAATTTQLAKNYTLLLKSPPHRIAKDAQTAGGPLAIHLPKFVAALRPTKSFYKLSVHHEISLADVQLFARHLIYWRRAIAIPPLNQRDTYIVSPNADFRRLREACRSYESQFPASLPTLPQLLRLLSGLPRPFGTLIPSPDHKDTYMLVLAWLMRHGLVTQLRTFAFVRVSSDVKKEVRDRERAGRYSSSQSVNNADDINGGQNHANTPHRPSFVSRRSSDSRQSVRDSKSLKGVTLIKNTQRATPEESRWLTYLHENILEPDGMFGNLEQEEREELYRYWPLLSKHFDGTTALESVPVREGLKRKMTWNLYGKYGLNFEHGVEDERGLNKTIIVTIRHW